MRFLCALMAVIMLTESAYGQRQTPQPAPGPPPKTPSEIAADKAADRAYHSSLKNIPDQPAADPWGGARATDAAKTSTKAKPATKTPAN